MRIKSTKVRPNIPRPTGKAKVAVALSQKSPTAAEAPHAPRYLRKKEKSCKGVLSQLISQFSTVQCSHSSKQDLKLSAKAYSQQVLPILPKTAHHEAEMLVDPKSQVAKRNDKGHSRQGNLFHAATSDWADRNGVYQSVHAEGRVEVRS